jgi:hypothetical protein
VNKAPGAVEGNDGEGDESDGSGDEVVVLDSKGKKASEEEKAE